ncbi:MAG: glycosyltransferase family 4 protein [Anaerolineae bacterium]|nr:glycosyltransferase family 4 protein [Anaerolineae bacterium]
MTRVCMVVHQDYYRDTRVRRYAEALADAGVPVDVLCVRRKSRGAPLELKSNIRVFTIPMGRQYGGSASYFLEYGLALILYTIWLLVLYIRHPYRVIHVHNMPDFLVFAALIPRLLGAKLILDIHDPTPEFYMSKYQKSPESRLVRLLLLQERLSTGFAHAVITANQNFKANLVARGIPADKIAVVYNLPDPRIFNRERFPKANDAGAHFTLIYPGTIAPRYNLETAIQAMPALVDAIPSIHLVILGPQVDYVNELKALAQRLGVAEYVTFKPEVPAEQVPENIVAADVGIYTAIPDAHMDIAVPSKVLEYAIMGVPVVASRLTVLRDLFSDTAIRFFTPGDVDDFVRCVCALYDDPALRRALVEEADRVFVSTHGWPHERAVYFDVMERLASGLFEGGGR